MLTQNPGFRCHEMNLRVLCQRFPPPGSSRSREPHRQKPGGPATRLNRTVLPNCQLPEQNGGCLAERDQTGRFER